MDRRDFLKTMGAGGALLSMPGAGRAGSSGPAERPNIVLIMADDMGYSDLGCYGSEIETPNLDGLAEDGLKFTQFYNAARCCPTRASLLTGLYPHQAGVGHMVDDRGAPGYRGHLNRQCVTIAEALKRGGYHTLMAGKWHVGHGEGMWPVDRGFDEHFGILQGATNYFNPAPRSLLARNRELVEAGQDFYTTDDFTDYAIQFMEDYHGRNGAPFFLYVAYNAPHWPLHARPEDIEKYEGRYMKGWDALREERQQRQLSMGLVDPEWPLSRRDKKAPAWNKVSADKKREMAHKMAVYAAMVDCMDRNIGRVVESVRKTGRMDNTLIMFLSDNRGEEGRGGVRGIVRQLRPVLVKRRQHPLPHAQALDPRGRDIHPANRALAPGHRAARKNGRPGRTRDRHHGHLPGRGGRLLSRFLQWQQYHSA
jgi:arylsulfatase